MYMRKELEGARYSNSALLDNNSNLQVEIDSNRHSQWGRVAGPCPSPSVNSDSRDAAEDAFCLREADGIHVSLS